MVFGAAFFMFKSGASDSSGIFIRCGGLDIITNYISLFYYYMI